MTKVTNAAGEETLYKYDIKHKRLNSITTINKNNTIACKERFFWHRPNVSQKLEKAKEKCPYFPFPQMGAHTDVHSEFLLCSRVFEGDGIYYFCRQLQYDNFGNVEKNYLWGNLTGRNNISISLKNGVPKDNGCEVYTRILKSTHDGRNLPTYENDGRKWVRQTYSSMTDKPIRRLTGSGEKVLKREFFSYDNQGVLINETWDDGTAEKIDDLTNVTERHVRITVPRTEMPMGLPETVTDYYCDLHANDKKNIFVKKYVNVHSSEGRLLSQQHYDSHEQLAFILQWEYDRLGNVTLERNALGESITRQFDENGNKTMEVQAGLKKTFTYDFSNRLCEEKETWVNGQTFITQHRYNLISQKIASIDPYGHKTNYKYDRLGHLKKTIFPSLFDAEGKLYSPKVESHFNAMGQEIDHRDVNGNVTNKNYTIRGQPFLINYPDGSTDKKEYSLDGLLVKDEAKNGLVTTYIHDPFGRITRTEKWDNDKLLNFTTATYNTFHLIEEKDETGILTTYTYDGVGRRASMTRKDKVVIYAYDTHGRLYKETQGETVKVHLYDLLDRIIEERIEDLSGTVFQNEQFEYDIYGNRTRTIAHTQAGIAVHTTSYNPHGDPTCITDAIGNATHFTYDTVHYHNQIVRRTTKTDPLGNQEVVIYDTHGHISLLTCKNPFGQIVRSEKRLHDAAGQHLQTLAEVYTPNAPVRFVLTEWTYDAMGNMTSCTEAKGTSEEKTTRFHYNGKGEKDKTIKNDGTTLFHCHDRLGQLVRLYSSDNTIDYTYTYDAKGNILSATDNILQTSVLRTYDSHDRLFTDTLSTGLTFSYTYDTLDRLKSVTLPDRSGISYTYDAHHLLCIDRICHQAVAYSHSYKLYDLAGNVLKVQLPRQTGSIHYCYDLLQRCISTEAPYWSERIPHDGFDASGNLLQRELVDDKGQLYCSYAYDDLYQLITETGYLPRRYGNDSLYNRISKDDTPCTVNSLNQLMHESERFYTYDRCGNLAKIENGNENALYFYDALDRLVEVHNGMGRVRYTYDAFHRRLSKESNGRITHFLYQHDDEIGSFTDGKITELRLLGTGHGAEIGAAIAIELQGTPYVPIHDTLGNITTLLDLSGKVAACYRYTAFGEEEMHGNQLNPWRFASKRVDPETGFIHFGRRYYLPAVGRWLTPDPLWFADGPNLYTYVHNHPLAYTDPDGQFAFFLIPLAISLAAEYLLPTAAVYMSEYAGGALAASFVMGMASGYCDTVSTAFDSGTYSVGEADLSTFACSRAGMMVGAMIAALPTSRGTKLTSTVGNMALSQCIRNRCSPGRESTRPPSDEKHRDHDRPKDHAGC